MPHAVNRRCCTCPEPDDYDPAVDEPLPTFKDKCACPSLQVECVSTQKTATLCGFDEGTGFESVPAKKYFTMTESHSGQYIVENECCDFDDCVDYNSRVETWSGSFTCNYVPGPTCGTYAQTGKASKRLILRGCDREFTGGPREVFLVSDETTEEGFCSPSLGGGSGWQVTGTTTASKDNFFGTLRQDRVLSAEDTEADALGRANEVAGASCSSLNQLRTTSFTFTVRTVTYTVTAQNLVEGVEYTGCIRMRRRRVYAGTPPAEADLDWEEIEPDTIEPFTATGAEVELAAGESLPNEQGWEYAFGGVNEAGDPTSNAFHIWPTRADCECPSNYVAP